MTIMLVLNDNVSIINVYNVSTELRINQLFDLFLGLITFIKKKSFDGVGVVHSCVRPYKTTHNQTRPFKTLQGNSFAY